MCFISELTVFTHTTLSRLSSSRACRPIRSQKPLRRCPESFSIVMLRNFASRLLCKCLRPGCGACRKRSLGQSQPTARCPARPESTLERHKSGKFVEAFAKYRGKVSIVVEIFGAPRGKFTMVVETFRGITLSNKSTDTVQLFILKM